MTPEQILAGARTVATLATHFEELKQRAIAAQLRGTAQARGYFTPAEDEELRHLLVSYTQSRNALLELITSFRHDAALPDELRPAAFLVAFAAAALLVDAARFLRENFNDVPVITGKLNEPEPYFGISAGTYDQVQRSLTSPRHAWHLYHALAYYDEHREELKRLAAGGPLEPAWAVTERLVDRVRVPAQRYANARARVHVRQARSRFGRDLLGRAMFGLAKLISGSMAGVSVRPGHVPSIPPSIRAQLAALLRPGDVIITRKEHALTNYFLPGYWPHAALYLGNSAALEELGMREHPNVAPRWAQLLSQGDTEDCRVLEAMKDGVLIRSLNSPLGSDALVVLRPQLSSSDVAQALARGLFHEGKPYDFDFDFTRSDRLVCTEVVYRSYDGIGGLRFDLTRRAGRMTLAAEDLLAMALARSGFDPVAIYSSPHCTDLCQGGEVDGILRATRGQTAPASPSYERTN